MNISKPPLLIHIGYPKSASSWLQDFIFPDTRLGFMSPWGNKTKTYMIHKGSEFSAESVFNLFEPGLKEAADLGLVPTISNEHLTGILGFSHKSLSKWSSAHSRLIPERLYKAFPQAKILIIIREQKSFIMSAYRQNIRTGGTQYINQYISDKNDPAGIFPLDALRYDVLIEQYQSLFGRDNILVLPFELIRKKQDRFFKSIFDFLGIQVDSSCYSNKSSRNVGLKGGSLMLKRQFNVLCNSLFVSPESEGFRDRGILQSEAMQSMSVKLSIASGFLIPGSVHKSIESRFKTHIEKCIGSYYAHSNQQAARLTDIDLDHWGYDC